MARSSSMGGTLLGLFLVLLLLVLAVVPFPSLSVPLDHRRVEVAPRGRVLSPDFYRDTCPQLEGIVRSAVRAALRGDASVVPGLLRIHYHDCISQGCDASLLLRGKGTEQAHHVNQNLNPGAMDLIETIRAAAHARCGPVVSCADVTALAAREAVVATGGPRYAVNLGQLDALSPAPFEEASDIPGSWNSNVTRLLGDYSHRNFTVVDLVALSGAHTLGSATCLAIYDRVRRWDDDLTRRVGQDCERDPSTRHSLDARTPRVFDNRYFVGLLDGQGVLTSDRALVWDARSLPVVQLFARDQRRFFDAFSKAMRHLTALRKHPGAGGEVRNVSCFMPNNGGSHARARSTGSDDGIEGDAASA